MSHASSTTPTERAIVLCDCGKDGRIRTSWTDENPGRRFYGCVDWRRSGGGCNFFAWIDPPVNARPRRVILDLHRQNRELEAELRNARKMVMVLKLAVFIVSILWVWEKKFL